MDLDFIQKTCDINWLREPDPAFIFLALLKKILTWCSKFGTLGRGGIVGLFLNLFLISLHLGISSFIEKYTFTSEFNEFNYASFSCFEDDKTIC